METTELLMEGATFVRALERVLPRHGYRAQRTFDKHLDNGTAYQATQAEQPCQCGCGYTVLLVFPDIPNAPLEGTITIQGMTGRSVVSLLAPDSDGRLTAQFPTILVEAIGLGDEGGKMCRCDSV